MNHEPTDCAECGESVMPIGVEKRCPLCGHEHHGGGRIRTKRVTFVREDTAGHIPDTPSYYLRPASMMETRFMEKARERLIEEIRDYLADD